MSSNRCVLLAGGLGTRLGTITRDQIPKALVQVGGVPFLHFKLRSLIEMGFASVDLLTGQHGDQIERFIKDRNYPELTIRCFHDGNTLLGTAGAVASQLANLPSTFWLSYADTFVLADIARANRQIMPEAGSIMVVLRNQDRVETSNVKVDSSRGRVVEYHEKPLIGTCDWIDYGLLRFNRSEFIDVPLTSPCDLKQIVLAQIHAGKMFAFETNEPFWDVGTPDRLIETTNEFRKRGWLP